MIWYRAKEPDIYPRYNKWSGIKANEWRTEDFQRFEVKIDETVYTKDSKTFRKHFEKNKMWEKLSV